MEQTEEKKPCFIVRAWRWVGRNIKASWRFLFPDRTKARIENISEDYEVVLKNGDLYLVYKSTVVIKKLPACYQNLDTIDLIEDTGKAQLEWEGLTTRP